MGEGGNNGHPKTLRFPYPEGHIGIETFVTDKPVEPGLMSSMSFLSESAKTAEELCLEVAETSQEKDECAELKSTSYRSV